MHITRSELAHLADSLFEARVTGKPCAPITEQKKISLADAYLISEINLKRRLQQAKARVLGKKIGLTSRAVQKQLGVHEPDFGYLTSDMSVPMGESVAINTMIQPKVEGELAFVLKRDLVGPGITVAQVIQATDFVLPCIEIIDSRIKDWKIRIEDTVADNASSALFVLGTEPHSLRGAHLRTTGMSLRINGELRSTGVGAACLDHPALAVAWLANSLSHFGEKLHAGDIILSGAFGPVVPVGKGERVDVDFAKLGSVFCFFE